MPIKGEQGYTCKVLINGEWQEVTIQENPLELVERLEQDEEWTRVRHGHWIWDSYIYDAPWQCSECGSFNEYDSNYCPDCGAKMNEEKEDG